MKANYKFMNNKVIEQTTCHIIFTSKKQKELIAVANFLNAGGGFDGLTPYFFLDKNHKHEIHK